VHAKKGKRCFEGGETFHWGEWRGLGEIRTVLLVENLGEIYGGKRSPEGEGPRESHLGRGESSEHGFISSDMTGDWRKRV